MLVVKTQQGCWLPRNRDWFFKDRGRFFKDRGGFLRDRGEFFWDRGLENINVGCQFRDGCQGTGFQEEGWWWLRA